MNVPLLMSGAAPVIMDIVLASVQEDGVSHGFGHRAGVPLRLLELLRALDLLLDFVVAQTDQVGFGGIKMWVTHYLGVPQIPPQARREWLQDEV